MAWVPLYCKRDTLSCQFPGHSPKQKNLCGIGIRIPCNCFCMSEVSPLYLLEADIGGNRPQATGGDYKKNLIWLPTEGYRECFFNCSHMIWRSSADQGSSSGLQTSCHVSLRNRLSRTSSRVRRFFTLIRGDWKCKSSTW